MDERKIQKILTEILFAVVNEAPSDPAIVEKITPDILVPVCRLAKKHDLLHVVARFIYKNKIEVNNELRAILRREEYISIYRYERMKYAFEEICGTFDEAKIAYVPLKGSVLRAYYPYESMRTSCDIDILIHESDLKSATNCLESIGYHCGERNYHDISMYSPNNVHLELHFSIQENIDSLDKVLKNVWDYTELTQGSRYDLKKDFLILHIYAHMAYHFLSGGCGIRSLLDIWIMEHKMNAPYSCAETLLKKAGIYTFAKEMSIIANKCFTNNELDAFSDLVLKYIYSGGIYGTARNNIAAHRVKTKNTACYVLKRLFPPNKHMVEIYPILKKLPFLLPFCWIMRCISVLLQGKTKRIAYELSYAKNISNDLMCELTELCSRLDI
jgi:hypothetical protein